MCGRKIVQKIRSLFQSSFPKLCFRTATFLLLSVTKGELKSSATNTAMGGYFNMVPRLLIILSYPTASGLICWKPVFYNFDLKNDSKMDISNDKF